MVIGCPKEIKNNEFRSAMTPSSVYAYVGAGHKVLVQRDAGIGSGIRNEEYLDAGCVLADTAEEIWSSADMIVKVKEPLEAEYPLMRNGQILFTYFHFAASEPLTRACMERGIIAIAYETVQDEKGGLPLLKPMSEVAGRMAPLMGACYLGRTYGGRGILPTGVPGVIPATCLILGGGTVGSNAARVAAGLGARVVVLDLNIDVLEVLGNIMPPNVFPVYSDVKTVQKYVEEADMVIGAVLVPGARAPRLVNRTMLKSMKEGAVLVDVAIDQGGCFETSVPTTHSEPVYSVDGIVHYCVANMPGAYAKTSTSALTNVTTRYGLLLANEGVRRACQRYGSLKAGLNMVSGKITSKAVADAFGLQKEYREPDSIL